MNHAGFPQPDIGDFFCYYRPVDNIKSLKFTMKTLGIYLISIHFFLHAQKKMSQDGGESQGADRKKPA